MPSVAGRGGGGSRRPAARPAITTAMPAHISAVGARLPVATPVSAAETGAMPVSRPTRPGPSADTAEYQSTNAATVTSTAGTPPR